MPPRSEELLKPWKIAISAELAGQIEFALTDPITNAPKYGARKRLIEDLLGFWLARESGLPPERFPEIATLEQLRSL